MLDALERQWHTASVVATIKGDEVEPWATVQENFDEYLEGEARPKTKDQEWRHLLGLK